MILLNKSLIADEAKQVNLVSEVTTNDELMERGK